MLKYDGWKMEGREFKEEKKDSEQKKASGQSRKGRSELVLQYHQFLSKDITSDLQRIELCQQEMLPLTFIACRNLRIIRLYLNTQHKKLIFTPEASSILAPPGSFQGCPSASVHKD